MKKLLIYLKKYQKELQSENFPFISGIQKRFAESM